MSRAYRIQTSRTVERVVVVDDAVCTDLELLPLLPKERLSTLLEDELKQRGFEVEEGVAVRDEEGNIRVEVDLETARVTVRATGETTVSHTATRGSYADDDKARARIEREAETAANKRIDVEAEAIEAQATQVLEAAVRELRDELDQVVHGVTASALKEKAASLGEITELSEDPETGEMTIKVKV